MKFFFLFVLLCMLYAGCENPQDQTLFKLVPVDHHGIDFQNTVKETDSINILTLEYIYNGGGVGIADFNKDGLRDVFLTGNMVANKLYLNQGGLKFQDVSATAGITAAEKWKSGVAIADVNGDGWDDIYVCATIRPDSLLRQNILFINKGLNSDGVLVFKDEAAAYGVNYAGHSSGAAFLDYDNDNDLDLYVITNTIVKGIPTSYRQKINDGTVNADILYRNNGNGTFTDVSKRAGILHEGYGLGLAIADVNQDGWQDIYVSNDYITNDLLYINNGNGTFTNDIDRCIKHQSHFSMGNDIADFNNDGFPDIVTLDMLPEGNLRRKTVINGTNYSSYINNEKYNYSHQYIRNMLQLNNGDGTFSEIGQLAGIYQTEWSWAPLFVDVDNDGFKDLLVTNGFPRDVTDKDFGNFRAETSNIASVAYQIDSIPVVKVSNYIFNNNGDLTFKDVTKKWGLTHASFSNGTSFADLDNDGDLDFVINNINDNIFLYENTLYNEAVAERSNHFLRLKLSGVKFNSAALGTKIQLRYGKGLTQYHDHSLYRGYISSVEDIVHFGVGEFRSIDTVVVQWPDGKVNLLTNVAVDQVLEIRYNDSAPASYPAVLTRAAKDTYLRNITNNTGIQFVHSEDDKIDFNIQRTIPHKFSQAGPGMAAGDVNNDGLDDFYIGGSVRHDGTLFIQKRDGTFQKQAIQKSKTSAEEDQGALFFDADNDNDLDLYVVSGTFEYAAGSAAQQDRLYLNDGKGNFSISESSIPETTSSGSCVRATDIDNDGDLDLFVGGRVVPGRYPLPAESYLLINEEGKFSNRTQDICSELQHLGMVTDALWTDFNNDGKPDLVVAGEFMPIHVFQNDGRKLTRLSQTGLEHFSGWWNSLAGADFDLDGDVDFIAGNLGQNNYYKASPQTPLKVYAKDFDGNNSIDAILTCYFLAEDGTMKEFPIHFWDELNSQSPKFRKKFKYYKQYGRATIDNVLTPEDTTDATILVTNYIASSYIENKGNGKFVVKALPQHVQFAPINGIITSDFNLDGAPDVLMVGNDYGNEIFSGRFDAFPGSLLLNDGAGNFRSLGFLETGFRVEGDAKSLVKLNSPSGEIYVASQNRDSLKFFTLSASEKQRVFKPGASDVWAELIDSNEKKRKVEFYFGSGYLSQSSRVIMLAPTIKSLVVYDRSGKSRTVELGLPL